MANVITYRDIDVLVVSHSTEAFATVAPKPDVVDGNGVVVEAFGGGYLLTNKDGARRVIFPSFYTEAEVEAGLAILAPGARFRPALAVSTPVEGLPEGLSVLTVSKRTLVGAPLDPSSWIASGVEMRDIASLLKRHDASRTTWTKSPLTLGEKPVAVQFLVETEVNVEAQLASLPQGWG